MTLTENEAHDSSSKNSTWNSGFSSLQEFPWNNRGGEGGGVLPSFIACRQWQAEDAIRLDLTGGRTKAKGVFPVCVVSMLQLSTTHFG